jgi:hypothetical protein
MPKLLRTPTKMTPSNTKNYIPPSTPATMLNIYLDHAKEYPLFSKQLLTRIVNATNNLIAKLFLQEAMDEIERYETTINADVAITAEHIRTLIRNAQDELRPYNPPGISTHNPIHYCGDQYCNIDCGVQSCGGCIDVCRCDRFFD